MKTFRTNLSFMLDYAVAEQRATKANAGIVSLDDDGAVLESRLDRRDCKRTNTRLRAKKGRGQDSASSI